VIDFAEFQKRCDGCVVVADRPVRFSLLSQRRHVAAQIHPVYFRGKLVFANGKELSGLLLVSIHGLFVLSIPKTLSVRI
jgi:hypothetical protein